MLEISVKTLDGQTRKFSVPDDMTVADFKERIAEPVNIPAARQRVIFQGRLLANETRLGDLDLNGRAVHVVERSPPPAHPPEQQQQPEQESHGGQRGRPDFIMAGAFEVPADIQQVVQQAVNQFGPAARGASVETRRMPGGAPGLQVHIRLPPPGSAGATGAGSPQDRTAHEVSERIRIANKMLNLASHVATLLESNTPVDTPSTSGESNAGTSLQQQPVPPPPTLPADPEVGLANTVASIAAFNDRLKPLLDEFSQRVLARNQEQGESSIDQRTARLAQGIPEIFHHVAHAFHNLSDLIVSDPQQVAGAAPGPRITVASSTVTPVQGVGVYQQVFTVPVVEIQAGGSHAHQPSQQNSQQESSNQGTLPRSQGTGTGPFVFAQRMPNINPFGFFPRPPVATMITNRPVGPNQGPNVPEQNAGNFVRPIDQNLPCLSRHFLAPHVLEAARLSSANSATQQPNVQQQQQQQQGQQQPGQQGAAGVDPTNMINMFQEITNFVMQAIVQAGTPESGPQQQQQSQQQANQQNRQQQQPVPPVDFLSSIQQLAGNIPAAEPFGQIVRSLGQLFADPSGSASRTSAFDFIQGLGNVPPMAPSPINNLIEVVMRSLAMSDFIRLIMGDTSPLARVHAPVREHLINSMRSSDGSDNTSGGVSVAVEAIVGELRQIYEFVFSEIETRDNVDLIASMIAHDRHWVTRLVNLVVDSQVPVGPVEVNNVPLYRQIYDTFLSAAHEAVVLIIISIGQENARPTMRRLVERAVANMEQGGQPGTSQSTFVVDALSDFTDRLVAESPQRVPRSQIEQFIVRRIPPTAAAQQQSPPTPVPQVVSISPSVASQQQQAADMSWVDTGAQDRARANVLLTNHVNLPGNQTASGDWRTVVPAEWIPVIDEDAAKQQLAENSRQPPLSDAYLSGLPAKRRRMAMEQLANDALAHGQMAQGFADTLGQAVRDTGVPAAIAPGLIEEATSNEELGSLFQNEVLRQLRNRLSSDPNFDPARHSDIANFFNKSRPDQP